MDGGDAPNGPKGGYAWARVIYHVTSVNFVDFGEFFAINKEVKSIKYILDVRPVFEFAGSEDEDEEGTEEREDLKTHLGN